MFCLWSKNHCLDNFLVFESSISKSVRSDPSLTVTLYKGNIRRLVAQKWSKSDFFRQIDENKHYWKLDFKWNKLLKVPLKIKIDEFLEGVQYGPPPKRLNLLVFDNVTPFSASFANFSGLVSILKLNRYKKSILGVSIKSVNWN